MVGGKQKSSSDRGIFVLITLFILLSPILVTPWIHGHDGLGHYMILRSAVIDKDLDYTNEIALYQDKFPDLTFPISELTNRPYTHYGIGNALLWSPFFLLAHLYVNINQFVGGPAVADGFSLPYLYLVCFSSALYAFIGLILIYKILRSYASMAASLATTLLLWFATPLFYYMYFSSTVSHATSFFGVSLFLWYWHKTRLKRTLPQWIILGLLSGLVFIIRQEDALILIFPVVDSLQQYIRSAKKYRLDIDMLKKNISYLLALGSIMFVQFSFFNQLYGKYFVTGEQLKQHYFSVYNILFFYKELFSIDHGLFMWIPISLFGILGIYFIAKKDKPFAIACSLAVILFVAFTSSVKQWMAIGSFSARHFTGMLGVFGFGIAAFWDEINKKVQIPWLACIAALLIFWNLNVTLQYGASIMQLQDPMFLPNILYDTMYTLPEKIIEILSRFLFNRGDFISS